MADSRYSTLKAFLIAFAAWLVPGLGHLIQGRVFRGLLLGLTVLITFLNGSILGGHLFGAYGTDDGLLAYVFGFCDAGAAGPYLLAPVFGIGTVPTPERATAEYGNVFFMVAGLLNYLVALDAFDISVGRKR